MHKGFKRGWGLYFCSESLPPFYTLCARLSRLLADGMSTKISCVDRKLVLAPNLKNTHKFFSITSIISARRSGPAATRLFSCSTQLSTKFILIINVKMPTSSMINSTSERFNARNFFSCQYISFLKFRAQLD